MVWGSRPRLTSNVQPRVTTNLGALVDTTLAATACYCTLLMPLHPPISADRDLVVVL